MIYNEVPELDGRKINPFSDEYTIQEIEWYGLKEAEMNGARLITRKLRGRADEYLNKRFFTGKFDVPIFYLDKKLWMSLTPLEVQSAYIAIEHANGIVGTGGLGMGYFTLKVAESDLVEKVIVYEINKDCIDFFNANFSDRTGFEKIEIKHMDVNSEHNQYFNFFFMDIYPTQLPDDVLSDRRRFLKYNTVEEYRFWCQERIVLEAIINEWGDVSTFHEKWFFGAFWEAKYSEEERSKSDLLNTFLTDEFIEEALLELELI